MTNKNLYHPFEVDFKELEQFPKTIRKNNFFELIYIVDGTGIQIINDNKFQYRKGNLFLVTPQDVHLFEVLTPTKFFFFGLMNIISKQILKTDNMKRFCEWNIYFKMQVIARDVF